MEKYNVDFFIKKYEAIPEEKWCVDSRLNYKGQRCAHGLCYIEDPHINRNKKEEEIEQALVGLAVENIDIVKVSGFGWINNGIHSDYQQPTPKQRVLAALYDIKAKEAPIKERIVYVMCDKKVRELQKEELILN